MINWEDGEFGNDENNHGIKADVFHDVKTDYNN